MALSEPVLTPPGGGEAYQYGSGSGAELKLEGGQSGGDYAVVEWTVRAGDEPPIHTHTREDETVFLLERRDHRLRRRRQLRGAGRLVRGAAQGRAARTQGQGRRGAPARDPLPAGAERFFVPPEGKEPDPAEFGIEMVGPVPA